jgi:hypothetical protein
MRQLLMERSRVYLAHHSAGLIEEDFQLPCLVEDPAVARYGTKFRSRYIDNEGGDNDGSDEPVTEATADLFSPGPNHVEESLRNQYLSVGAIDIGGEEISRHRTRSSSVPAPLSWFKWKDAVDCGVAR